MSRSSASGATGGGKHEIQAPPDSAEANARDRTGKKVVMVLVNAALETVKTKKGFELITADSHASLLRKAGKDPVDMRPDIVHQCLLQLLDSPLNKAGLLKIYIQTKRNELIDVSPHLRIPRTFKRFCGLMVQLLHKLKIRASDGPDVLLKMVKHDVTTHLPVGAPRIGTSVRGQLVDMREFAASLPQDRPVVYVVGQQPHGEAKVEWTERSISVSQYPLSACVALGRIVNAYENLWGVL